MVDREDGAADRKNCAVDRGGGAIPMEVDALISKGKGKPKGKGAGQRFLPAGSGVALQKFQMFKLVPNWNP